MGSNYTTLIHLGITLDGKRLVSEQIIQSEWSAYRSSAFPVLMLVYATHSAQSLLKQDYKEDMSLEDAKSLALKIMSKTMDSTKLGSEKRESRFPPTLSSTLCPDHARTWPPQLNSQQ